MNIVVLSDIHGNYHALSKCIEFALTREPDAFVFLGDYVGELAYPQKTMEIVYQLQKDYVCYFIRGNKEDYWLNYKKSGELGWKDQDSTTGSLLYTYQNLTEKDLDFFEGLSQVQELSFDGMPSLMACHGSPDKANEKMLPDQERTFALMEENRNALIVCGHTHLQGVIEHKGKRALNPGAVGVPLNSGGKAQFMILHSNDENWEWEFISLDYDVEKVISDLHESDLDKHAPCWCKVSENLLRKGGPSHGTVLSRAMDLCREEMGECIWPNVPEKYWELAVEEMRNQAL